jgi:hypothetical protein
VEYVDHFPHSYLLKEHDPAEACSTTYEFKGPGASDLAPVYEIEVQPDPATGSLWCGSVYGGAQGLTRVLTLPNPGFVACVANGVGYSICAGCPDEYRVLPIPAIRDTICDDRSQRAIFLGWTGVLVVGPTEQDEWSARKLVSDGFTSYSVNDGTLTVRGFFAPVNSDVEITLDLLTGREMERW